MSIGLNENGFLGNTWEQWGLFALSLAVTIFVFRVVLAFFRARLRKVASQTPARWDDALLLVLDQTHFWFALALALRIALHSLEIHEKAERAVEIAFVVALFAQLGIWVSSAITFFGTSYAQSTMQRDAGRATTVAALVFLGQAAIWILMSLLLLGNLGYNVSALIAGLGVGGIAIALAVQNILGDLFASLSIVLDKPFVIGDAITVDKDSGTVEHIGLKTTRVRSVSGEQLIFSNSDLLKSRIRNFQRLPQRRVQLSFALRYESSAADLAKVEQIARTVVEDAPGTRFDNCQLARFGTVGLEFDLFYWVKPESFSQLGAIQNRVALALAHAIRREGLDFARVAATAPPAPGAEA